MTRFPQLILGFGFGICLAASVAIDAVAGPINAAFTASVSTLEYLQPSLGTGCGVLPLAGISVGSGTASPLGRVAIVATDCVAPVDGKFVFSNGKMTFTAANGDTLRAEYMGEFVPQTGNVYTINSGTFRIIGGTGQFTRATGGGELRGTETLGSSLLEPARGQLQAIGTISY